MILVMVLLFLALLVFGFPVAFSLGIPAVLYIMVDGTIPDFMATQNMVSGVNSYPLLAVPFFIFAGNLMNFSGVTTRIFDFSTKWVGHIKGGLAHVNVLASIIFAGMSGTAVADAGGLGIIEIKAMRDAGYDDDITIGITAASSTVGPIIPPSMVAVIYGTVASASIGRLLVGGLIPGILMGIALMVQIYFMAGKHRYPIAEKASFRDRLISFHTAFWSILTPLIILGGIGSGVFTPTEAAGIACAYAVVLGFCIYRELTPKLFWEAVRSSAYATAQMLFIVAAATLFAWILAKEQIPQVVAQFLLTKIHNYYVLLFLINIVLLIVGCFMETVAAINILVPVFMPLIEQMGIDPIHFGMIMILNLVIGCITPPFGTVLFILSSVAKTPIDKVARATFKFYPSLLVVLILVTYIPQITLFLPDILFGITK
jgi:tripartite ATP-independent transporter DctM subunit